MKALRLSRLPDERRGKAAGHEAKGIHYNPSIFFILPPPSFSF